MCFKIYSVILIIYKRDYSTGGQNEAMKTKFSGYSLCLFVSLSLRLIMSSTSTTGSMCKPNCSDYTLISFHMSGVIRSIIVERKGEDLSYGLDLR